MIFGERIRLRPIERDDLPRYLHWFQDPEVREGLSLILPFNLDQETQWYERVIAGNPNEFIFAADAEHADGWIHIGSVGLHRVDWRNRSTELGIVIGDKAYWSRGYGSDMVRTVTRFAFDTLNLHRVWLRVFDYNKRAIRAYEKAGFTHEGRFRQDLYKFGHYHDTLIMSVLRPEFEAAHPTA